MNKTEKNFDAVVFMRQQRDRLSETLSKMTKNEIINYFKEVSYKTSLKPSFS